MKTKRTRREAIRWVLRMAIAAAPFAAIGCMVGPNYKPPATTMPPAYGESANTPTTQPTTQPTFSASGPAEIAWWRQLGDPELTNLVEKSIRANNGVAVAEAHLREARAARQVAQ